MSALNRTLGTLVLAGTLGAVPLLALSETSPGWTEKATRAVVARVYYEGLPLDAAQSLPPVATRHLAAILNDPELDAYHSNAMLALGMSGHPGSYEILTDYPLVLEGEISRHSYQILVARKIAMGHLGRRDERAVQWLLDQLQRSSPNPAFSFRALQGARLARELRGQNASAVALSGSTRAREALIELQRKRKARGRSRVSLSEASLDAALEQLDRIRSEGPEQALASPFSSIGQEAKGAK